MSGRWSFSAGRAAPVEKATTALASLGDMAVDTVGAVLRILGENALDRPEADSVSFSAVCEQWAQHVLTGAPPPGGEAGEGSRRDWAGVREFVRAYCQGSVGHVRAVMGDLRQVVWLFIQTLSHTLAEDREADSRLEAQLHRLELLARGSSTDELKKEVLATVVTVSQLVEARRHRQRQQVELLGAQVRNLGQELEVVRKESEVDPLTRLYNRRALDEYLARTVELYRAFGQETCLLLVDVDGFKTVNDTLGHPAGDALLRRMADTMVRVFLRKSDFVARFGGDELAVVLRETPLEHAGGLAERAVRAVRGMTFEHDGDAVPTSISVGVAALGPGDDVPRWIDRADRALYQAKREGRDRVITAA
jgi:diguanylate cyclase (GGDEF)-like protein